MNKPIGKISWINRRNTIGIITLCTVILLLFTAVTLGPVVLGTVGLTDSGVQNEIAGEQVTVAGVLIDNRTGNRINSSTENISVILRDQNGALNATSQPKFNFSVEETQLTNATLIAVADGYEGKRVNISEARASTRLSLDPITSVNTTPEISRLYGNIRDPVSNRFVSGATVVLTANNGETIETTSESYGTYYFNNVSYGEYTLSASAPGFVTLENHTINVNSSETRVRPLNLTLAASMSILFIENNTDEPLYGGVVQLTNVETGTNFLTRNRGATGWFNATNLASGTYRVELSRPGYENIKLSITLGPGDAYVGRVRVAFAGS